MAAQVRIKASYGSILIDKEDLMAGDVVVKKLTRKEIADGVYAQLGGVGPQTVPEIQADLKLTKRQVEDALWLLCSSGRAEYAGQGLPLTYKVVRDTPDVRGGAVT